MKPNLALFIVLILVNLSNVALADGVKNSFNKRRFFINAKVIPRVFRSSINEFLKNKELSVDVPIVLPTKLNFSQIPMISNFGGNGDYYSISLYDSNDYTTNKVCKAKPYDCGLGMIIGYVPRKKALSLIAEQNIIKERFENYKKICKKYKICTTDQIETSRKIVSNVRLISLHRGKKGLFTPFICLGTNCDKPKIQWEDGKFRYEIYTQSRSSKDMLESASLDFKKMVEMANSAIDNQS